MGRCLEIHIRAFMVVMITPCINDFLHSHQRGEVIDLQTDVAKFALKTFNERISCRFAALVTANS